MNRVREVSWLVALLLAISTALIASLLANSLEVSATTEHPRQSWLSLNTIHGVVLNDKGTVAGATVRVQLTENKTLSADDGTFTLSNISSSQVVTLTAWAEGHYIGWTRVTPGVGPVIITMGEHFTSDNVNYDWFEFAGTEGSAACGLCHIAYNEWKEDIHSQTATNYRFLTMYAGTDIQGNQSPQTQYDTKTGLGLLPDATQPYFGPGFRLDNPNRPGVCASCHTPMAAKIPTTSGCGWSGCHTSYTAQVSELIPDGASPTHLTGDAAEGISCEFCHKIGGVQINDDTGLPYEDSPGIMSLKLLRPTEGHDIFFGSRDDVVRTDLKVPRDSFLPLQKESEFCASCHYGVLGGVVANMKVSGGVLVYSSFKEWLESPYNADKSGKPEDGKTCQGCHMPTGFTDHVAFTEKGGPPRDPDSIHSHKMLGAYDKSFLQQSVSLTATAKLENEKLVVDISLVNDQAGHDIPTDSVLRHVMLVVTATDSAGKVLTLSSGESLPAWAGNYAELPGRIFAKVLKDEWTGESPTGAIWRPVSVVSDTRLKPFVPDTSQYIFDTGASEPATVDVQLLYRYAPQELMKQKSWPDQDVVMKHEILTLQEK